MFLKFATIKTLKLYCHYLCFGELNGESNDHWIGLRLIVAKIAFHCVLSAALCILCLSKNTSSCNFLFFNLRFSCLAMRALYCSLSTSMCVIVALNFLLAFCGDFGCTTVITGTKGTGFSSSVASISDMTAVSPGSAASGPAAKFNSHKMVKYSFFE